MGSNLPTRNSWLSTFIVAAFALCAGFVGGSMLGLRERSALKSKNQERLKKEIELSDRVREAESQHNELMAQLDQAEEEIRRCHQASSSPVDQIASLLHSEELGPLMSPGSDASYAEQRLAELECEVAALRELVSQNDQPSVGPPSPTPPSPAPSPTAGTSAVLAKVAAGAAAREQCTAITKKGVRCSRPARSNGKCWQHGG